jgi:hypothetical protein
LLLIAGVIIALAVNKKAFVNNESNTIETVNTVEENKPAENNA